MYAPELIEFHPFFSRCVRPWSGGWAPARRMCDCVHPWASTPPPLASQTGMRPAPSGTLNFLKYIFTVTVIELIKKRMTSKYHHQQSIASIPCNCHCGSWPRVHQLIMNWIIGSINFVVDFKSPHSRLWQVINNFSILSIFENFVKAKVKNYVLL